MSSPKKYRLDEISGSEFASLSVARGSTNDLLAELLTKKIHAMLKQGDLIIENGIIHPSKTLKS